LFDSVLIIFSSTLRPAPKSTKMNKDNLSVIAILIIISIAVASAAPALEEGQYGPPRRALIDLENPREVLRVLDALATAIIESQNVAVYAEKRGLDLGLGRGFSGRQAAKHLVGLASAQFAGGPGKR